MVSEYLVVKISMSWMHIKWNNESKQNYQLFMLILQKQPNIKLGKWIFKNGKFASMNWNNEMKNFSKTIFNWKTLKSKLCNWQMKLAKCYIWKSNWQIKVGKSEIIGKK